MVHHNKRPQHLHIDLGGLGQQVKRVIVELTRPGAPAVKPDIVISGEYEENPLFARLYNSITRITDVMSQYNWDPALLAEISDMDIPLDSFSNHLKRIHKEKGQDQTRKMLDAAMEKLWKTEFFIKLPDGERKREQVRMTLNKHFEDTFGMQAAHSLRPSRL